MVKKVEISDGKIFSVSAGYNYQTWESYEEEAISFDKDLLKLAFPKASTTVLLNKDLTPSSIHSSVMEHSLKAKKEDTLFFFFSGHGLPYTIMLKSEPKHTDYPKTSLFRELSFFPGRKIVILSCCHGAFPNISENTLLLTPSKQETPAYANKFFYHLLFEFCNAESAPHALSYLIEKFLKSYHNRPYGPLEGDWQKDPNNSDLEIYEEEKRLGRALLKGYQRACVFSTLVEKGNILAVDPSCFFEE